MKEVCYYTYSTRRVEKFFQPAFGYNQESKMLNRIANVFTFLTFGLLMAITSMGAIAIHDFNNRGNAIFVREWQQHANYTIGEIEGNLIGYQVHYQTCGQTKTRDQAEILAGAEVVLSTNEVIASPTTIYGRIEKREHIPFWTYHPLSKQEIQRLGLSNIDRSRNQPDFEWGSGTRRVCRIDLTGVGKAAYSLAQSLI